MELNSKQVLIKFNQTRLIRSQYDQRQILSTDSQFIIFKRHLQHSRWSVVHWKLSVNVHWTCLNIKQLCFFWFFNRFCIIDCSKLASSTEANLFAVNVNFIAIVNALPSFHLLHTHTRCHRNASKVIIRFLQRRASGRHRLLPSSQWLIKLTTFLMLKLANEAEDVPGKPIKLHHLRLYWVENLKPFHQTHHCKVHHSTFLLVQIMVLLIQFKMLA